ncbi:Ribokinase [Portunus trituberculatus]|uniref:Ribokinase n=1 Tax=Portunus trituberculatus TaxID=210409 RepID=A0A5B7H211_PORTR|nr:Ribokinase [Portunus trituberculatus]
MVAMVGDDLFGQNYLENLKSNNVDISFVGVSKEAATGVAPIVVDDAGVAAHWCYLLFAHHCTL